MSKMETLTITVTPNVNIFEEEIVNRHSLIYVGFGDALKMDGGSTSLISLHSEEPSKENFGHMFAWVELHTPVKA